MADNTVINVGSGGDVIRDIDRTTAKTQVVGLDFGGTSGAGGEQLATSANPLPVVEVTAQSSDSPNFVAITGDPTGDFAGQNLLELVMNDQSGLNFNVKVVNPPKVDATGAAIASDAPAPIPLSGVVNANLVIDTTGYQSISIQTSTLAGNVTCSDDGATWFALSGTNKVIAAAYVTAVTAGASFNFPCLARYIRITVTTAGAGVAYLRSQPWNPGYSTPLPSNVSQLGGTAVVTGGLAGVLAVGGNVAQGVAPTTNPVNIGGWDGTYTRRLLTDTSGRPLIATDTTGSGVLSVRQDYGSQANEPLIDIQTKILMQLKRISYLLGELPATLSQSMVTTTFVPPQADDEIAFLNDPQLLQQ